MGRMEPLASAAFGREGRGFFMLRMRHAVEEIFFASERGLGGRGESLLVASAEAKMFVIRKRKVGSQNSVVILACWAAC